MTDYWHIRAEALRDELTRTRQVVRRLEIREKNYRFIAIAGWVVAIGMYVLGSLK